MYTYPYLSNLEVHYTCWAIEMLLRCNTGTNDNDLSLDCYFLDLNSVYKLVNIKKNSVPSVIESYDVKGRETKLSLQ